jgi:hypothetical protein
VDDGGGRYVDDKFLELCKMQMVTSDGNANEQPQQKIHVKHSRSNGNMRTFSSSDAGVGDEPRSTMPAVQVEEGGGGGLGGVV